MVQFSYRSNLHYTAFVVCLSRTLGDGGDSTEGADPFTRIALPILVGGASRGVGGGIHAFFVLFNAFSISVRHMPRALTFHISFTVSFIFFSGGVFGQLHDVLA